MLYKDDMNNVYSVQVEERPRNMGTTIITQSSVSTNSVVDVRLSIEQTKALINQLQQIVNNSGE